MKALTKRHWINWGLLCLAVGLAGLAWFEPGRELPLTWPLLDIASTEAIARIEVLRLDQETLVFEQQEGRWRMTAPNHGWANLILIHQMLDAAQMRCFRQYPAAELKISLLQLDSPQVQLRLDDREIRFGVTTPMDGLRYLQVGTTVHLCPDRLYNLLTSSAAGFLAPVLESPQSPVPAR